MCKESCHSCLGHDHGHSEKHKLPTLIVGALLFIASWFVQNDMQLYLLVIGYIILGGDVLLRAAKNIMRGQVFDENFLMTIATLGAFAIGEYTEAVGVMLFYQVGELFQDHAVSRSKESIAKLMDIRPDYANLLVSGEEKTVSPATLQIGDLIVVKPGERVPIDGTIIDGVSTIDTRALTGESMPSEVTVGESILSGCINLSGVLRIKTDKTYNNSTVSKILDLVENSAEKKAPTENFITTFSRYYTPAVVIIAVLLAFVPPVFVGNLYEWISRGLVFFVISCPCALVISIPLGFFGGIGGASKKGILIKGGNYLEALCKLDTVVFDKTGTLTKGVFEVVSINSKGISKDELIEYAAYAEYYSNHPIAKSLSNAYLRDIDKSKINEYTELPGRGIRAVVGGKNVLAGNEKLLPPKEFGYQPSSEIGTSIYLSIDGVYVGCITIADVVKADSKLTINSLKAKGIRQTIMLTGDNDTIAQKVGAELGIDQVYSQLLPDQKVSHIEQLNEGKSKDKKLAFIGDGINDAPVLAMSDIGIAMGGMGSDAAIEAADIVFMTDEPSKLIQAIDIAVYTKKIVWQNIVFALGVKLLFLVLGAMGLASLWEAVFADVGVALLAIFNAMRVYSRA